MTNPKRPKRESEDGVKKEDFDNSLEFWKETAKLRYEEMVACQAKIQELACELEQANILRDKAQEERNLLLNGSAKLAKERDALRAKCNELDAMAQDDADLAIKTSKECDKLKRILKLAVDEMNGHGCRWEIIEQAEEALNAQAPEEEG